MKISIVIDNGKVTVDVDDEKPITITQQKPVAPPVPEPQVIPAPIDDTRETLPYKPQEKITLPPARASGVKSRPAARTCETCSIVFEPKTIKSRFCSKKCATKAYNRKHREKVLADESPDPTDDRIKYCKHCLAWTDHDWRDHPKDEEPAESTPPIEPEPEIETPDEPDVELRSVCCDAKVEDHTKPNGKQTHICKGCGHQCATKEFLPGHEKSAEELEEIRASFEPIVPGSDKYSAATRTDAEARRRKRPPTGIRTMEQ